jgi:hypothetical protein
MTSEDWRSPARYQDLRALDGSGFAWEYLRRNSAFSAERTELEHADRDGALDPNDADDFARRWGVRFREQRRQLDSGSRSMDGPGASDGHRIDRPSAKSGDT